MSKNKPQLKMFVWGDVLRDYYPGIIVVHAANVDEAIELAVRDVHTVGVTRHHSNYAHCAAWAAEHRNELREELRNKKPRVIRGRGAAHCHGGG